jgi:hypothetical protein
LGIRILTKKIFFQIIGGAISMGREATPHRNPLVKLGGWSYPPGSWLKEIVVKSGMRKIKSSLTLS